MPSNEQKLILKLEAQNAKYLQKIDQAEKRIRGFERQSKKSLAGLKRAFTVLAAAISIREIVRYGDEWTNLTNRLRLVTDSQEGLAKATQDVTDIARDTRAGLAATADLYNRLSRSTDKLNVSQERIAAIAETVNKTLAISGATTESAKSAIIQFGQGLSAGQLRGQEFNSVVEQSPRLAQALADALGKSTGELRELAKQGGLTSEVVVAALEDQADAVDAEFGKVETTVSQALTVLDNAFLELIGNLNDSTKAGSKLADAILEFADLIRDPETIQAAQDLGAAVVTAFNGATKAIAGTVKATQELAENLARNLGGAAADDVIGLEQQLANIDKLLTGSLLEKAGRLRFFGKDGIVEYYDRDELLETKADIETRLKEIRESAGQVSSQRTNTLLDNLFKDDSLFGFEGGGAIPAKTKNPLLESIGGDDGQKEIDQALRKFQSSLKDLTTPQQEYADNVARAEMLLESATISQFQYNEAVDQYKRELDEATGVNEQWKQDLQDAAALAAKVITPLEAMQMELARTKELIDKGLLDPEVLERIKSDYQKLIDESEKSSEGMSEAFKSATQNIQSYIADDIVASMSEGLGSLEDRVKETVKRIAAEFAAAQLTEAIMGLFGGFGGGGGGSGEDAFAAGAAEILGSFEGGGFTGGGPRMGGLDGRGGNLAMVHPNESIVDHNSGQSMGNVSINQSFYGKTDIDQVNRANAAAKREIARSMNNFGRY